MSEMWQAVGVINRRCNIKCLHNQINKRFCHE
jgi:hypothetical protein